MNIPHSCRSCIHFHTNGYTAICGVRIGHMYVDDDLRPVCTAYEPKDIGLKCKGPCG
jgi:hypothetical protein